MTFDVHCQYHNDNFGTDTHSHLHEYDECSHKKNNIYTQHSTFNIQHSTHSLGEKRPQENEKMNGLEMFLQLEIP